MGTVEYLHERYISRDFYNSKGAQSLPNWTSLAPPLKDTFQSAGTPARRTSSPYRDYLSSPASAIPISNLAL